MRVLLDECVPRKLARDLVGHEVTTVPQAKLGGTADDRLLQAAHAMFDLFVTVDRNLVFQQNLTTLPIAVIVLHAKTNRHSDLQPLAAPILQAMNHIRPREVIHLHAATN